MTKVVNCKKEKYDVYIGRPSIFGNPYKIGKDGSREEVIQKYKLFFYMKLSRNKEFFKKIWALKNKILGCYCKPLACHGDIIAEYLDKYD